MSETSSINGPALSSRARVFEDEKARIKRYCFAKLDEEGHLVESYITHCRIIEDNQYPSGPPPYDSPPDQKKSRVIIVAVRKSGRVRLHKARENPNGSFSIGKVWDLDSLSQIENHTGEHDKGFTVTLVKPYYWQAGSIKEKDLFVQSLVKIFQRYTGGRIPALVNFERTSLETFAKDVAASAKGGNRLEEPPAQPRQRSPSRARSPVGSMNSSFSQTTTLALESRSQSQSRPPPISGARQMGSFDTASNASLRSNMSADSRLPPPRSANRQYTPTGEINRDAIPAPSPRRKQSDASTRSGLSGKLSTSNFSALQQADDSASIMSTSSRETTRPEPPKESKYRNIPEPIKPPAPSPIPPSPIQTTVTSPPIQANQTPSPSSANGDSKLGKEGVASRFRLAANAYALSRKKTPTTPDTPKSPLSKTSSDKMKSPGVRDLKISSPMPIVSPPPTIVEPPPEDRPFQQEETDRFDGYDQNDFSPREQDRYDEPPPRTPTPPPPVPKRKRAHTFTSYLEGFDRSALEVDVEAVLNEFGWDGKGKVETLEETIKRELESVESKNVMVNTSGDVRIQELERLMDNAIAECEKMDGLLTLYAVEMTSLHEDITHIEDQSHGLQVQTANQRTLQKELQSLLETISISPSQLDVLKTGSLETHNSLERIESALVSLYKAMSTIDPTIRLGRDNNENAERPDSISDETLGPMRALQDKKDGYRMDSREFLNRLRQFLDIKYKSEMIDLQKSTDRVVVDNKGRPRLPGHDNAYYRLHKFSGFILFARDIDRAEYFEIQKLYQRPVQALYQEQFRDNIFAWRRMARRPIQDDAELVFTYNEKEAEGGSGGGVASTVRTLTVKRSQTLAKIRSGSDSSDKKDRNQDGKIYWNEAFNGALTETFTAIFREQNFIAEYFHLNPSAASDFTEFVSASRPDERKLGDMGAKWPFDTDKRRMNELVDFMTNLFGFWINDVQGMVDWAIKQEPLQGVGLLQAMEEKIAYLDGSNQEFLLRNLDKQHARLEGLFNKFVDEQVRAIEDTKVKLKKRKGVIAFIKVFPHFALRIEEQLNGTALPVRRMVDKAYKRITTSIFDSLAAIAKEQPPVVPANLAVSSIASTHLDPEDKEALNSHILLIENAFHFLDAVSVLQSDYPNENFRSSLEQASQLYDDHLNQYINAVLRRPLGKVLDFIDILESSPDKESVIARTSHSKSAFKKLTQHYDVKEIKRGIETLKKRVEKHFAEADDEGYSSKLMAELTKTLGERFIEVGERLGTLGRELYGENGKAGGVEWGREDVWAAFRK